jgi:adenosylhomocysteine nucleosidase
LALSRVGIVCALVSEARHLGPISLAEPVESLPEGTLVAVTGMGEAAASRGAAALIAAGAGALASFGMAGGLDPTLSAGAILLPGEVIGPDGRRIGTEAGWRERLRLAIGAHTPCSSANLLTMPRAVASIADKAYLFRTTGAAAVDMESLAVGEMAARHRLPFVAVRVVVDSAEDALPRAVMAAADKEGRLQIGRLMSALARAPQELAPLIRLARRYRAANRSLAAIARTGSLGVAPATTFTNNTANSG